MANPEYYDRKAREALAGLARLGQGGGALHYVKNVLNGGELGPELWARLDQQRFGTGFYSLENMLPLATGGIRRRPGLGHLGYIGADGAEAFRLVPFIFSASESLVLEFSIKGGKCRMRSWDIAGACRECLDNLPFDAEILAGLSYCQSADVLFLAHRKMAPRKISRYAMDDWRFEKIDWTPAIAAPEWFWCGPRGDAPQNESRRVSLEYVCTAIDKETGEESPPSKPWNLWGQYPLTESRYMELRPKRMEQAAEFRVYKKTAGVFGYIGRIEAWKENELVGQDDLKLDDKNIAPDTEDTPPNAKNPFDGPENWPGIVFLHQQRLGFAASSAKPLTFWLSQAGNFESMAASIPPDEDDSIEATLAAPQANRIIWAVSDRGGLAFGTEGGEWLLAPSKGSALSPSDLSFQPQSGYGSQEGLPASRSAGSILFAQRGGRILRDFAYSFQDDRYNAQDLSILARHITKNAPIRSMAWQQEPRAILWCCLGDGILAGLTWLREHEVMAWHRHLTDGKFLQVCSIPGADGDWLAHFAILRQTADGMKISLERLRGEDDPDQTDGIGRAQYVSRAMPITPELSGNDGASLGLARKISSAKFAVLDSQPFSCRVVSQNARPSPAMRLPARQSQEGPGFKCWNTPLNAGFLENPALEITTTKPLTLLAISYAIEFSDTQGNQI